VVFALPGQGARAPGCRRRLALQQGEWIVVDIEGEQART